MTFKINMYKGSLKTLCSTLENTPTKETGKKNKNRAFKEETSQAIRVEWLNWSQEM